MAQPSVISLYTGVGGLDFGFEAAGFRTAVAVEMDSICCRNLERNRSDWSLVEGDIHQITSRSILRKAGLRKGDADVLVGGPPCQPFSKSGYWANGDAQRLKDPRAGTLTEYLRVLRDTQPRAFLLENVRGLAYRGKDEGLQLLINEIDAINRACGTRYTLSYKTLNAAAFGVPQLRERVFLIGSRDGTPFEFPKPTHADLSNGHLATKAADLDPYRTAWDALGDLPQELDDPALIVGGRWGDLLPTIPEGENYLFHTNRGGGSPLFGWRRRYWTFLLKLAKCRPASTIQAQPGTATGPFHWRSRRLSTQELCRLQAFPDGLQLEGGRGDIQRMLGNAVPSLLAEILAREISRQLLGRRLRRPLQLLRPILGATPPPERPARLPKKYRSLIGEHADHPGTGKGPSVLTRTESRPALV